jgi:phosphatidylethanolamine/phosphatidyl-N-methylethanolamine N-methyltransferase
MKPVQAKAVARDLPASTVEKAYGYWVWIYDAVCGPVFRSAHVAITDAANRIGGHVLEVGVGTGLLLPRYRRDMMFTGVDLSEKMLARARLSLEAREQDRQSVGPRSVSLEVGDIHDLAHPDQTYDSIVFPFVLTLVANPELALDNCRRMLRPGGEIIVVSHFESQAPFIARFERWLAPHIAGIGLRPDFPVERVAAWASIHDDMIFLKTEPVGMLGVYTLLRISRKR